MTATQDNTGPDPQQIIAELQRKLDEARAELAARNSAYTERIAYQGAANDVLKVMSASPGDPQPVFDLISVRARDICDAYGVTVYEFDGSLSRRLADCAPSPFRIRTSTRRWSTGAGRSGTCRFICT